MKLEPKEVELIERLRRLVNGRLTVVKDGGAIRQIRLEPKKTVDKKTRP